MAFYINSSADLTAKLPPQTQDILSVSSLNKMARSLLEANFPSVVVEGEISNLAKPASGHWYLTLKDKSAQIKCAMFAGQNRLIRFQPENGQQVLVRGRLSLYEGRGDYQLILNAMEAAGDGALQRAFEALKAKLLAEGLFEERHKQAIANNYKHIGLITSATGAAVHDMITVFKRRSPRTRLTLIPVAVQGSAAADEIVNAIETANALASKLRLDALIIGRGGGSLEDLQPFNEERVARAVFASGLPIVSAVGHETDFSIADFVADLRAPTPSAAAELLSTSQQDLADQLLRFESSFSQQITQKLRRFSQQLLWLTKQLKHPGRRLLEHAQTLDRLEMRLLKATHAHVESKSTSTNALLQRLLSHSPKRRVAQMGTDLIGKNKRLLHGINASLQAKQAQLASLSRNLNTVSPLNTLARGYSITFNDSNSIIRSTSTLAIGEQITTQLHDGKITSTIQQISPSPAAKKPR